MGELLTATSLVKLLNTYFSEMTTLIHAGNGITDKFVGDGLMAFWTAPFSRGDSHASDACLAAFGQQDAVERLREHLSDILGLRRDLPEFVVRMGGPRHWRSGSRHDRRTRRAVLYGNRRHKLHGAPDRYPIPPLIRSPHGLS